MGRDWPVMKLATIAWYRDGKEPEQELGDTFEFVGDKNDLCEGVFD